MPEILNSLPPYLVGLAALGIIGLILWLVDGDG
jgi:hypothetical protein